MQSTSASPPPAIPAGLRAALFEATPEADREFRIGELPDRSSISPMFWMEGVVAAPLRLVAAMVRESDLGTLAGSLARWDVLESERSEPFSQRVFYVSKLPWPFADRAFHIRSWTERPAPQSLVIQSTSLEPDDAVRARLGKAAWGKVEFSGYHLVRLAPGSTWLRRVIGVELGLPLPRGFQRWMLRQVYRGNYEWMNETARAGSLDRFEQRMASDPLYASLDS